MYRLSRSFRPAVKSATGRRAAAPTLRRTFFWSSASSSTSSTSTAAMDLAATSIPHCDSSLLPYLFGVVLANAATGLEDDEEVDKLHSPPWKVVSMAGKGFGAIAERDLGLGELLIGERPLCVWPSRLNEEQAKKLFDELDEREQQAFMQLAPVAAKDADLDEIRSRRAANGFSIALPAVPGYSATQNVGMVFPKISRINHSCTPNASQVMNFMTLRMEVFSIAPIPAGSEVLIEYIPGLITQTKAERQAALYESFGFDQCLCAVCTAPPSEIAKSDDRRREIKRLSETLEGVKDREATLAKFERIRVLLQEEGFKGLPAFADPGVSSAFRVYLSLRARAQRANPE